METLLYGKNLCNLLSNRIINEFNSIDVNNKTEVYVVNVNNFLIIKGKTTIATPVNFSPLFQSYLKDRFDTEYNFNVIDLIEYSSKIFNDILSITENMTREDVNIKYLNNDLQGYINIDDDFNIIYSNNQSIIDEYKKLNDIHNHKVVIKEDSPVFISDKFYGLSLYGEKSYITYLKYIFFHITEKNLTKSINFNVFYEGNINELNWETMKFSISSEKCLVNIKWLESLILDLFPFEIKEVIESLDLKNYDFENDIIQKNECWKKRDKIGEFILL